MATVNDQFGRRHETVEELAADLFAYWADALLL
jgi:hypothetical protein